MTGAGYSVILFRSVHHVMWAEKLLKEKQFPSKLIPVPRHISSNCGVCLRIARDAEPLAADILSGMAEPYRMVPLD